MERIIADARDETAADERLTVAAEVARLVEISGLSRTEFAARVGTSTSRLSTYVTQARSLRRQHCCCGWNGLELPAILGPS